MPKLERISFLLSTAGLLSIQLVLAATAQSYSSADSKPLSMPMPSTAPLFIENDNFSSTIHLVNEATTDGWVNLTLFDLSGNQIASVPEYFGAVTDRTFQVKELLRSSGLFSSAGSVRLMRVPSSKPIAVLGQVSITHFQGGAYAYLDEEFAMPTEGGSNVLRAVAEGFANHTIISVSNTSSRALSSTINCISNTSRPTNLNVPLRPYETKLLRPCIQSVGESTIEDLSELEKGPSADADGDNTSRPADVFGISITSNGKEGDLAAYGLVSRPAKSGLDLGSIEFLDPTSLKSPGLVFSGVPVGYTNLLRNNYSVRIGLSNFGSQPAQVYVYMSRNNGDKPTSDLVKQVRLASNSTSVINLTELKGDPDVRNSFIVRSDSQPGTVISKLVARVEGIARRVEMSGKDEEQDNNGGGHPWSVADGITSTLVLFNHDSKPQPITVHVGTDNSHWQKSYNVQSMQTLTIDMATLVRDQVKDDKGVALPLDSVNGDVGWLAPQPHATGRLLQSDSVTGMARNFSCGEHNYLCGAFLDGNPFLDTIILDTGPLGVATGHTCFQEGPPAGGCTVGGNPQTGTIVNGLTHNWLQTSNSAISTIQSGGPSDTSATYLGVNEGATSAVVGLSAANMGSCSTDGPIKVGQRRESLQSFDCSGTNASGLIVASWGKFGTSCLLSDTLPAPPGGSCGLNSTQTMNVYTYVRSGDSYTCTVSGQPTRIMNSNCTAFEDSGVGTSTVCVPPALP
ncbi:MAG TPA: hypothetical protein VK578_19625 [Edaphobacter sp.]|nr:hypothetical protein [Edaphobacter sp.]